MVQHLLVIKVAAPAVLLADPLPVVLWGLPAAARVRAGRLLARRAPLRAAWQALTWTPVAWLAYALAPPGVSLARIAASERCGCGASLPVMSVCAQRGGASASQRSATASSATTSTVPARPSADPVSTTATTVRVAAVAIAR